MRTEILPVIGDEQAAPVRRLLVPVVCGVAIAGSWCAACLTIVLPG